MARRIQASQRTGERIEELLADLPEDGGLREALPQDGRGGSGLRRAPGVHPGVFDRATFTEAIQPRLKTISVAETMRATGLSRPFCTMIRRGDYVPHPRRWGALEGLGG